MLETIIGYIFLSLLALFTLFFCFVGLYVFISEHETDIKAYASIILCIIGLVSVLIFLGLEISKTINPPETIEVDGYTYHISYDVPDKTVEQYGHKYILSNEG